MPEVWIRLGVALQADPEHIQGMKDSDERILEKALHEQGCVATGNSYVPGGNGLDPDLDTEFDLSEVEMATRDSVREALEAPYEDLIKLMASRNPTVMDIVRTRLANGWK